MTALFFVIIAIISIVISDLADITLRRVFYDVAQLDTKPAIDVAVRRATQSLWFWRGLKFILSVAAAYFGATYALRPVKKSAEIQKRFAAVASHELRTPIAVMKSEVEVALRNKQLAPEQAVKVLNSTHEEIEKISDITEFLMVFSEIKTKTNKLPLQKIRIIPIMQKAVGDVSQVYPEWAKKISVSVQIPAETYISGNETGLYMLTVNLTKNALDHVGADGKVEVVLRETESRIELVVKDNGVGISKQDAPYIFEPFYRGQKEMNTASHGLGIGLSLVREIVSLHRAEIEVESQPGKGTQISVLFPKM